MKFKKLLVITIAAITLLTACGGNTNKTNETANKDTQTKTSTKPIVLQVGFENSISEPLGQGVTKWAELLNEKSNGTMKIEIFPDSQLGDKSSLIDSMLLGENVSTLADGAFYADYGVNDFGIVFGPFLFNSWDEVWKLSRYGIGRCLSSSSNSNNRWS